MFASAPRLLQATKCVLNRVNNYGPKAPFKTSFMESQTSISFDKNMPSKVSKKAWERDGEDKETWFKRKHAHHHAAEKKRQEEKEARKRARAHFQIDNSEHKPHRRELKTTLNELKLQPLIDHVYGTNPVLAALRANKRERFGRLFIHNPKDTDKTNEILKLAKDLNIQVVDNTTKQDLNLMTKNGVHNGVVLESKPIQIEDIKYLTTSTVEEYQVAKDDFGVSFVEKHQSVEKFSPAGNPKYPLGIYLDEISDPHNMGAIIRSAYYLGVDFIVFSERNCAALSPVVSKTSSGALEFMNVYSSSKPLQFFEKSGREGGWSIISSVSPESGSKAIKGATELNERNLGKVLENGPVLLVIGSEGQGIRTNLIQRSDFIVGLESVRGGAELDDSVDSLNASVATALLLSKFFV